jgi:iron complex outermembrane receptor protein
VDIDQIEIVRGPGAALYGPNCDRGILNIMTLSPFKAQGTSLELGVGERNVFTSSLRFAKAWNEKVAFKVTGQYARGDDWEFVDSVEVRERREAIDDGADPDTLLIGRRDASVERVAGEARIDWLPGIHSRLIAAAGFNQAMNNIDLTQIGAVQVRDWKSGYFQTRLQHKRLFGNAYMNLNDAGDSYLLRTGEHLIDNSREYGAELQHGFKPGIQSDITYGVDFLRTDPRTEGTITGRNENDDDMNELGIYGQFNAFVGERLNLVGAARVDYNNRFEGVVVSPRAALVYDVTKSQNLRLTYNRAFATPATDDLFVDIQVGSLSPLPYAVRAEGVPETGFHFRRDCGGLCMRSPFTPPSAGGPSTYLPADATLMWDAVVAILGTQGIDISMIPPPDASEVGTVLAMLDPETESFFPVSDVTDNPRLERRITNTLELGYKGRLGNRLTIGADGYVSRVNNFIGPLRVETPNVFFDQVSLKEYFENLGLPGSEADSLADAISSLPVGTITPEEAKDPYDVMMMVRNFGDVTIWGMDFAATLLLTQNLWLGGAYSFVSDDFFRFPDEGNLLATNSPINKGTLRLSYQSTGSGPFGELMGRAVASFPVVSGVYEGRVDSYGLMDLTLGYRFLWSGDLWFALTVQNVLDHRHQQFIGAPYIGRLALLKARVDF